MLPFPKTCLLLSHLQHESLSLVAPLTSEACTPTQNILPTPNPDGICSQFQTLAPLLCLPYVPSRTPTLGSWHTWMLSTRVQEMHKVPLPR